MNAREKTTTIRLSYELYERVRMFAELEDIKISELIRKALKQYTRKRIIATERRQNEQSEDIS